MTRTAFFALMTGAIAAGAAAATDPCPNGCVRSHLTGCQREKEPKPTCDSRIYPCSDAKYIRQFCGPQVCPNACFGYFPTQWRTWDAACGTPVAPAAMPVPPVDKKDPMPIPAAPIIPPVPD